MADNITERDLAALRGLLDPDHVEDPGPALPWQLMEHLRELFHCDYLELDRTESAAESLLFEQTLGEIREYDDEMPPEPHYWEHYWSTDACNYPDRTGDLAHVTRLSDFLSDREWRASPMYTDFGRVGQVRGMSVYLPDGPRQLLRLMFWRGRGRDFDERDRLMLTLLRPHLVAAYRRVERRRRAPAALTARQLELLQYVAQGSTNAQIARRMRLSEGTVRTHLNHIYERLGVTSRTAAVTRMSSAGLE
ncbi:regulatory LuxR family protein [Kribbella orskensis]|uniref:Regulatory LuxR family protein n=1 Tax=Kribbella orskensis TaxID=2512216 RepID=A0ABY2B9D1_9ACTN|nr:MULTISPECIES: LuxR C-terminal-related transcriptional regulator [Kribbella]TCN32152.1 regulatory LuxR family protein [Kribbella sp. VKM Ac-2500]TCO12171.1 regulatory LuxR family protein [Kribbella orskensis]